MKFNLVSFSSVFLLGIFLSCSSEPKEPLSHIEVPSESKSSEPNLLKGADGTIYLSWIETDSSKLSQLKYSTLNSNEEWSKPKMISQGKNWFVNWADFPSLTTFGENNLVSHFLEKSADDTYAYDVKLSISNDGGTTWNTAFSPHKDKTNTEHGFVSKLALDEDHFMATWLDGRQYAYAEKDTTLKKEMTLRSAIVNAKGELTQEFLVDSRVCDCCQTDMAMTKNGPMVVYRDRSNKEIRDIYYSTFSDSTWSEPKMVANDEWYIPGCPVNGPAIASLEGLTAVTWYTMIDQMPKVKVAFLQGENSFSRPFNLDFVNPLGRVDIEIIDASRALVSWMDNSDSKSKIQLQIIDSSGQKSQVFTVSEVSEERSSGFPRMIIKNEVIYITWTEVGEQLQVRSARINLKAIK